MCGFDMGAVYVIGLSRTMVNVIAQMPPKGPKKNPPAAIGRIGRPPSILSAADQVQYRRVRDRTSDHTHEADHNSIHLQGAVRVCAVWTSTNHIRYDVL